MTINEAIHSLRPNTEWSMSDDDVENIVWHTPNVKPLTLAEVEQESARLNAQVASKKASATAKLEALGLTADDLKALGL